MLNKSSCIQSTDHTKSFDNCQVFKCSLLGWIILLWDAALWDDLVRQPGGTPWKVILVVPSICKHILEVGKLHFNKRHSCLDYSMFLYQEEKRQNKQQ